MTDNRKTKKFIWFKIPKTGGTSFCDFFASEIIDSDDICDDDISSFSQRIIQIHPRRKNRPNFDRALDFKQRFPNIWQAATKITVVRHPYDRAVSGWRYLTNHGYIKRSAFLKILHQTPTCWATFSHFTIGQAEQLCSVLQDLDKAFICNENLAQEMITFAHEHDLKSRPSFGNLNSSARDTKEPYILSEIEKAAIVSKFDLDFDAFGFAR